MSEELLPVREFARAFAFDDIVIRSDGDGRTVEAFAAAFNVRSEIRDQEGHYNEELAPGSFAKTIADKGTNFGVFYNHARTLAGTPDGSLSVPIGVPLEVSEVDNGVWTVTRYLDNPLADSVLDGIKQRAIRGQSFSGRFIKSQRTRAVRGALPTIRRTEVAMNEYGPTVFPAYSEAAIIGVRSVANFLDEIAALADDDRDRLRQMLGIATDLGQPAGPTDTPPGAVLSDEPTDHGHSSRHSEKFHFAAEARKRGVRS